MNCPACQSENDASATHCGRCREPLSTQTQAVVAIDLSPGAIFHGRYQILSALGRGGMGMVYEAKDRTLDEVVAIKVLRPDFGQDPRMGERFRSEIKLARKVRHKNVCTIHDYGEDRGLLYISMELIGGTDLKRVLKERGGLPVGEAYDVSIQVAEGLRAVHEAGIIHRDLKTANIMLDARGLARLMDFGIAKREGDSTLTATGQVIGTPEYMSPEQAEGRKVDFRSDIYALGVVTYEIFTGQVPFRGETPISTILKHLQDPPPLDGPQGARLPVDLKPVLRRALAKSPADRYPTAGDFVEALRQARSPSGRQMPVPTAALEAPTLPRPRTPGWGFQPWFLVIPVAALALAGGAYLLEHRGLAPVAEESPSSSPATVATPPPTPPVPSPSPTPVVASPTPGPRVTTPTPPARAPRVTAAASTPPASTPPPAAEAVALPTPAPAEPSGSGLLQIAVRPWAEVTVDGAVVGTTPLDKIALPVGPHSVRIHHPGYEVVERRVIIRLGQTEHLVFDLPSQGVKKP